MVNERVSARIKGVPIQIAGVGDFWSDDCKPKKCLIHRSQNPPRDPVILLCHNPDAKEILKPYFGILCLPVIPMVDNLSFLSLIMLPLLQFLTNQWSRGYIGWIKIETNSHNPWSRQSLRLPFKLPTRDQPDRIGF